MTTRLAGTTAHLPPMRTRTGSGRPMPIKPFRHFLVQKNMDRRLGGKNNIQPTPRHNKDLPGSLSGLSMNKSSTKSRARVVPRAAHHSYAEWCKERGVDAPNVSIHYLSSSLPDGAETERGCLVTEPIEPGRFQPPLFPSKSAPFPKSPRVNNGSPPHPSTKSRPSTRLNSSPQLQHRQGKSSRDAPRPSSSRSRHPRPTHFPSGARTNSGTNRRESPPVDPRRNSAWHSR